jgi:uncharacterized membrane protein
MSPIILELLVLGLGLCLLLFEAFAEKQSRNLIAWLGIIGLVAVFLLLQFGSISSHSEVAGYTQDAAALFFKKFVVLTTIVILVMSLDYADTIRAFVHGTSPDAGLGEFYSIPILTCAGMMWMASATDFILIFVSLELVTVSFYTLVAFTRKNAASLEAGAKSARLVVWRDVGRGWSRIQSGGGSVSVLGSGCLPGSTNSDHRVSISGVEGGRLHRSFARRRNFPASTGNRGQVDFGHGCLSRRDIDLRQFCSSSAN